MTNTTQQCPYKACYIIMLLEVTTLTSSCVCRRLCTFHCRSFETSSECSLRHGRARSLQWRLTEEQRLEVCWRQRRLRMSLQIIFWPKRFEIANFGMPRTHIDSRYWHVQCQVMNWFQKFSSKNASEGALKKTLGVVHCWGCLARFLWVAIHTCPSEMKM